MTPKEFKELYEQLSFDEAMIKPALDFLYEKGYLTKEEYVNRKSKRLIDIKICAPKFTKTALVVLYFDDYEWGIEVELDTMLNVISVALNTHNQGYQVLYNIGE